MIKTILRIQVQKPSGIEQFKKLMTTDETKHLELLQNIEKKVAVCCRKKYPKQNFRVRLIATTISDSQYFALEKNIKMIIF